MAVVEEKGNNAFVNFKIWQSKRQGSKTPNSSVIKSKNVIQGTSKLISENDQPSDEPTLRINKKGDYVESIIITCTCGKEIEVYFEYEE